MARSLAQQFEFIDDRGRLAFEGRFEAVGPFSGGYARIYEGGRWGYIDLAGKTVITPQFDDAHDFNGALALVSVGSNWGYINTQGDYVWRSDTAP